MSEIKVNGKSIQLTVPLNITISLGGPTQAATKVTSAPPSVVEKVPFIAPNLETRDGYDKDYLGFEVPLPQLTEQGSELAAKLEDGSPLLNYFRFSLVMHKARRMALFTAANVDWRPNSREVDGSKPTRKQLNGFTGSEKEDWVTDPRIPDNHQLPDYFYKKDGGAFDRGHLVRRDDVAWGANFEQMQVGNGDTFHTTNCSPQVGKFNRSNLGSFNWGDLENMIQRESKTERVCVLSGPVFRESDSFFHGLVKARTEVSVQIPETYWKIIVANNDGQPAAYGFILDQDLGDVDLHREFAIPQAWKQHLKPIQAIEALLGGLATFGPLIDWDQSGQ